MSIEIRLKKLRGSGGYIIATVTDEQQRKGNLGGPDLFLAPIGRIDPDKISKYYCNTCEKDFEGSPKVDYETLNETVAENLILLEKGQYLCINCGSVLAEYRNFSKPNENAEVGLAKPQPTISQTFADSSSGYSFLQQTDQTSGLVSFNSIIGIPVYDSEARKVGIVKQLGIKLGQTGIVLIVTKNDGSDTAIKWDDVKKIGEVVILGAQIQEIKCGSCGFENKPDAKFCESCGKKLK